MEQVNNGENGVIGVCRRKKNDKDPVVFYTDHLVMKGQTVKYTDVDTISLYAYTMKSGILFANFSGFIKFKLRDGKKLNWKIGGLSFVGLGSIKLKKELFGDMYEACLSTVISTRAAEYLTQINNGGTITIGNVSVNANTISGKAGLKKTEVPVTQIGGADLSSCNVSIYGTDMQRTVVNPVPSKIDNAVCLIPIMRTLAARNTAQPQ